MLFSHFNLGRCRNLPFRHSAAAFRCPTGHFDENGWEITLQTAYAIGSFAGLRGSMLPLMPPLKLLTWKPFCASTRAAK